MKTRIVAACAAIGAVASLGWVGAAPADAAGAPSAKVCVTTDEGKPYRAEISLLHREWWEFNGKTAYPAANGCVVFHRIIPGKIYRVVVDHDIVACQSGEHEDGTRYKYGTRQYLSAVSREKRAPRTGQIDFGHLLARHKSSSC